MVAEETFRILSYLYYHPKVFPHKRAISVQATYVSYKINGSLHLEAWFLSVLSLFYFKDCKDVPTITSCRLPELRWTEPRQHSRDQSQSLVAPLKAHFAPRSLTAVTLQTELCGSWASKLGPLSLNEISCDRQEGQKKKNSNESILECDSKLTNAYVHSEKLLQWVQSL